MATRQSLDTNSKANALIREREGIRDWVKQNMGGNVIHLERLERWRPVWRVDVDKQGTILPLLFKGERELLALPYPIEHEAAILRILEAEGFPAPHVYGICEQPHAIVMEWVRGGRHPALNRPASKEKDVIDADRWAASLHYIDMLARMHRIDPARFEAVGFEKPRGPEEIALNDFEGFYQMFLSTGLKDPFVEFVRGWLRRNVPRHRSRVTFVTGDCGQFLSEGENVTAILDFEEGYLGDNLHDLACYRGRHPVEDMGDIAALYHRYAEATGEKIDLPVVAYHTVVFLGLAYIGPLIGMLDPHPGGDWVECGLGTAYVGRKCAEAMAEILGVELDRVELPAPRPSREDIPLAKLAAEIRRVPTADWFPAWQRENLAAIPEYLRTLARFGAAIEEQDIGDVAELTGHRPANWLEADAELNRFVLGADPGHDAHLVRLFYRRCQRQLLLYIGPNAAADHVMLKPLEPLPKL